jgi:hypothetical protein
VLVTGCDPCDARIEGLRAEGNLVGIDVVDAAGVFLRGNLLRGNGGGVRAADTPADPVAGPRTLVVTGNRFVDNDAGGAGPAADPELPAASGTAIWLAGVRQAEVLGNEVDGSHLYGVALTALAGPTIDVAVRDNVVGGASEADLAWDGLGAQVCFACNRTAGGDEPTSQPPMAQTLYDCANPATVGVPEPRPLLGIGGRALAGSGGEDDEEDAPEAGTAVVRAPFADLVGHRAEPDR